MTTFIRNTQDKRVVLLLYTTHLKLKLPICTKEKRILISAKLISLYIEVPEHVICSDQIYKRSTFRADVVSTCPSA